MTLHILAPADPALAAYQGALADAPALDATVDIIPFAEYRGQLDAALNAGQAAYQVVFVPGHLWIPELAAAGKLAPLDDHIAALPTAYDDYQPGALLPLVADDMRYNDTTYMIPLFSDGHILFYNPDLVPLDRDPFPAREVNALAVAAKANGAAPPLALKAHPSEIFLDWLPYLLDRNGSLLDADHQPTFNNENGLQALQDYLALRGHAPADAHTYDNEAIAGALATGAVGMAVTWGGQAAPIFQREGSVAASTYRSAVFTTPWNATWGAAVPANLEPAQQRAAVELLLQLNQPSMDKRVLQVAGSPLRSGSYSHENMQRYPWLASQKQMLDTAMLLPKLPQLGGVLGALYGEVSAAFRGEKPAADALAAAEVAVRQALA